MDQDVQTNPKLNGLVCLRLRVLWISLTGFNLRDFIKAVKNCMDISHTIHLQNSDGKVTTFS
jgi:hypothetical protein